MGKESGLGANFYLDGTDISGDTGSLSNISKSMGTLPQTGIDKYAMERDFGKLDGRLVWQSWFNPSNQHPLLSNGTFRNDRFGSYFHKGDVLGTPVASIVGKQTNYNGKRNADGSFTIDLEMLSNQYWLDWGYSLTAGKRTDGAATNGTGVDFLAAGTFGLQFYVHLFAFTGTSVTIKVQQSSDNGSGDAFADVTGASTSALTSAGQAFRIATARNLSVERYLRVVTTGTFSNAVFAASVTMNRTEMTL